MEETNNKIEELKSALKLAGKLAIAAQNVINSNSKSISNAIEDLEIALEMYNDKIYSLI